MELEQFREPLSTFKQGAPRALTIRMTVKAKIRWVKLYRLSVQPVRVVVSSARVKRKVRSPSESKKNLERAGMHEFAPCVMCACMHVRA